MSIQTLSLVCLVILKPGLQSVMTTTVGGTWLV